MGDEHFLYRLSRQHSHFVDLSLNLVGDVEPDWMLMMLDLTYRKHSIGPSEHEIDTTASRRSTRRPASRGGLLEPGGSVTVSAGEETVRLIRLVPQNFAAAIKRKFHLHDA